MLFGRYNGSDQTAGLSPLAFTEHSDFSTTSRIHRSYNPGRTFPNPIKFKKEDGSEMSINYELNNDFYIGTRPTWFPTLIFGFPPYSGADLNELI